MTEKRLHVIEIKNIGIIGLIINIVLIFSILYVLSISTDVSEDPVEAATIHYEELDPASVPGLQFTTNTTAAAHANTLLDLMTLGDIKLLDLEDSYFHGTLIKDYIMGGTIYWELSDSVTVVFVEGFTGELIKYSCDDWEEGMISESEAEALAESIAHQFSQLPPDRSTPDSQFILLWTWETYNHTINETITVEYDYWKIRFDRTKATITADDKIVVMLNPNGDLYSYSKIWFMELGTLDTNYLISQSEAESTALAFVGEGSSVMSTMKRIVRPNHHWEEEPAYGLDPVCVYEIWVKDSEFNLWIVHVDGDTNQIVGGDYGHSFYE